MIWLTVMTLSGASLGIYQALATVPRQRILPVIGGVLLIVGLIVWPNIPPNDVVTPWWINTVGVAFFLLAFVAASSLYSAKLWMECFPEAGMTYWQFVSRDMTGSPYLRQQYAAMLADREELRATWDYDGRAGHSTDNGANDPPTPTKRP